MSGLAQIRRHGRIAGARNGSGYGGGSESRKWEKIVDEENPLMLSE
jgi:hypothetical protein